MHPGFTHCDVWAKGVGAIWPLIGRPNNKAGRKDVDGLRPQGVDVVPAVVRIVLVLFTDSAPAARTSLLPRCLSSTLRGQLSISPSPGGGMRSAFFAFLRIFPPFFKFSKNPDFCTFFVQLLNFFHISFSFSHSFVDFSFCHFCFFCIFLTFSSYFHMVC